MPLSMWAVCAYATGMTQAGADTEPGLRVFA